MRRAPGAQGGGVGSRQAPAGRGPLHRHARAHGQRPSRRALLRRGRGRAAGLLDRRRWVHDPRVRPRHRRRPQALHRHGQHARHPRSHRRGRRRRHHRRRRGPGRARRGGRPRPPHGRAGVLRHRPLLGGPHLVDAPPKHQCAGLHGDIQQGCAPRAGASRELGGQRRRGGAGGVRSRVQDAHPDGRDQVPAGSQRRAQGHPVAHRPGARRRERGRVRGREPHQGDRGLEAIKTMRAVSFTAVPVVDAPVDAQILQDGRGKKVVETFSATDLRDCPVAQLQSWLGISVTKFKKKVAEYRASNPVDTSSRVAGGAAATDTDADTASATDKENKEDSHHQQHQQMVTCSTESTLGDVIEKAAASHVHRLWVADEQGLLLGVVSLTDILRVVREAALGEDRELHDIVSS